MKMTKTKKEYKHKELEKILKAAILKRPKTSIKNYIAENKIWFIKLGDEKNDLILLSLKELKEYLKHLKTKKRCDPCTCKTKKVCSICNVFYCDRNFAYIAINYGKSICKNCANRRNAKYKQRYKKLKAIQRDIKQAIENRINKSHLMPD
jgi:hypothetical protein